MTADEYLLGILKRETVDTSLLSPVRAVVGTVQPVIQQWAGDKLISVHPTGSFMKGTANISGTDIDLFISLSEKTAESLKEIHEKLYNALKNSGYPPSRQNVSLNIRARGYSVDLVPGKRQQPFGSDHSLYRRRKETWTKTNVLTHIETVRASARQNEIRLVKLWRDQHKLDFPSFYLELTAIAALPRQYPETLNGNVWRVLTYLRDRFRLARVIDPANTNNVISEDLTDAEKVKIRDAAVQALSATNWNQIIV